MELANIVERPEALQAPLTRSIAGLPTLEHPTGRNFWRQFPSQAPTCFILTTWKLGVLAAPTCLRSLSQNRSEAADAPPHRCPWVHIERVQVPARESHGAFFLPRQLLPRAKATASRLRNSIVNGRALSILTDPFIDRYRPILGAS